MAAQDGKAFWQDRRVFVTGHTGFIGGWLSLSLAAMGARVTGYALTPPSHPCLFDAAKVAGGMAASHIADIRDGDALTAAMTAADPEVVIHLAAQPLVRRAHGDPVETFSTNVMGTVRVLEAVRACASVAAVVAMTSDKVYDNREWAWPYRETDALGGKEPYGTSKACCEHVVEAYRHSYLRARGVALASVRAGNVIGGGDWAEDRLVPDAMRAFSAGQPLMIRNPLAVRPWQHVLEPVKAILAIARLLRTDPKKGDGPWNVGPTADDARPVKEIADRMVDLWGGGAAWDLERGAQAYEARLLTLDSSFAMANLGWRPRWRLDEALARTISWYKAFYDQADMAAVSVAQIREFFDDQPLPLLLESA